VLKLTAPSRLPDIWHTCHMPLWSMALITGHLRSHGYGPRFRTVLRPVVVPSGRLDAVCAHGREGSRAPLTAVIALRVSVCQSGQLENRSRGWTYPPCMSTAGPQVREGKEGQQAGEQGPLHQQDVPARRLLHPRPAEPQMTAADACHGHHWQAVVRLDAASCVGC